MELETIDAVPPSRIDQNEADRKCREWLMAHGWEYPINIGLRMMLSASAPRRCRKKGPNSFGVFFLNHRDDKNSTYMGDQAYNAPIFLLWFRSPWPDISMEEITGAVFQASGQDFQVARDRLASLFGRTAADRAPVAEVRSLLAIRAMSR